VVNDSFFTRLQSWFKADQSGRFLAHILCEVARNQPEAMRDILCEVWGLGRRSLPGLTLQAEYSFRGKRGRRYADIAVFASPADVEPLGLIEIKYRDRLTAETESRPAQLVDYADWVATDTKRRILVLSRETLDLGEVPARTWTEMARLLRGHTSKSELVKLLVDHLEEEGIVMQKVETRAVVGFVKRLLCPRSGAGRQAGNLEGPTEFGKLLKNLQLLSDRFNGDFKRAWTLAGEQHDGDESRGTKVASIDFDLYPRFKEGISLPNSLHEDGTVSNNVRNGGQVDLYARHALGSGSGWLRVGYGFRIEVETSSSHEAGQLPDTYVYAWANGQEIQRQGLDLLREKKLNSFELITSHAEESIDKVEQLVRQQLEKLMADLCDTPKILSPKQKMAIRSLARSLKVR
jgi:hypothetical protein